MQVIEQQLSGLDHLLYFSAESDKDGSMTITLSFAQGTNPDIAQVQVQNKLQLATPLLPTEFSCRASASRSPRAISCWSSASSPQTAA